MTVYLFDPFLIDYSGHCFNYLEVVRQALNEKKIKSQIIGNELCISELRAKGVRGIFPKSALTPVKHKFHRSIISYIKSITGFQNDSDVEQFKNDFGNLIEKISPTCNDVIFINSLRPGQVLALARWLNEQDLSQYPRIILVLHFTSNLKNWPGFIYASQYRDAFKLCEESLKSGRLVLFADTEELIDEYETLGANQIHLAPIPTTWPEKQNSSKLSEENSQYLEINAKKPIIVAFVGQARKDKGFYSLLSIIKNFSDAINRQEVKFVVQTGPLNKLKAAEREYVEKLKIFHVEIVDQILDLAAYYQLIETANIILLPYIGHSYQSQSSGIFAEALSLGKIIVAPQNSWMGRQLNKFNLNDLGRFPANSSFTRQIADDISIAIKNYSETSRKFLIAKLVWREANDIGIIINSIKQKHIANDPTNEPSLHQEQNNGE